jgi:ELWxxDGT repeat protein
VLPNIVLFRGQDALNDSGLWETNGTGSGTFELAPAGIGAQGLSPTSITVLGGQVLFEGEDLSGHSGLWTTDGTAVGTAELTSIVGASSAGIAPSDLTVFGSEALFSGINTSGQTGLWTTDGTANGTLELAGTIGAAGAGVAPTDLTVFNQEALFTGTDTAGHLGLWVTNGTAAGTQELTGISSASPTGLDPSDMTVFNNEVLFNGVDANGLSGLWATDGTVGGTHELVAGTGGASDPAGLNPTNITVLNGEILFSGLDASGDMGLWVSNGTSAGTHELTGITGADPSGLAPSDLTVYNGEVLFRGLDQSGRAQLWITDGTVAGTHELTGIAGASTTGMGLDPSGFAVYGGVVLFSGVDSSGNHELWQTNGSAAGTTEIGPVSGTQSMGLFPTDLTAIAAGLPVSGPVVTAGASVSYVAGAAPVTLDAGLAVADATASSLSAGHGKHQRRLRSGRRAERGLAPGRHCEPVQRHHGRPDFIRLGEPCRL